MPDDREPNDVLATGHRSRASQSSGLFPARILSPARILPPARILIVSDAWRPQVNGVVRTLSTVATELVAMGHGVEVIGPDRFRTVPMPTYPDIRLALFPGRHIGSLIKRAWPDAMHIATEGPLGMAARRWARHRGCAFTTSFHTRFPEYLAARTRVPTAWSYAWLRRFHAAGEGMMVATPSLAEELQGRGFRNIVAWSRGVDLALFSPDPLAASPGHVPEDVHAGLPRPVFAYVGRIAVEKNIRAFLDLDLPGSKVVVGDGPQLAELRRAYPAVRFTGSRSGPALAAAYAGADVMAFPSRTDTFGLVLLEALACGTPVAAFPVTGPKDVLAGTPGEVGALDANLRAACLRALAADRAACRRHAQRFSWRACAELFVSNLVPFGGH